MTPIATATRASIGFETKTANSDVRAPFAIPTAAAKNSTPAAALMNKGPTVSMLFAAQFTASRTGSNA